MAAALLRKIHNMTFLNCSTVNIQFSFVLTDSKASPLFEEKSFHLAPRNPPPEAKPQYSRLSSRWQQNIQDGMSQTFPRERAVTMWSSSRHGPISDRVASERRSGVFTSTMALGSSSALNSCSMESMMFFQPSRRMLPCRWARSNTVLAAVCALLLLPNTVGRFSTDCSGRAHRQ